MDAMQEMYQQIILEHAREKHGFGSLAVAQGKSFQKNPTCGDEMTLRVKLDDPQAADPVITDLAWEGEGCSISQASASVMYDLVIGQKLSKSQELYEYFHELMSGRGEPLADEEKADALEDATAFVGTAKFPARIKCALLGWMALKDALAQASATGSVGEGSAGNLHC